MDRQILKRALEAVLFVSGEPVAFDRLRAVFEPDGVSVEELREFLAELVEESAERGVEVREVAGGYQLRTPQEMARWVVRLDMPKPVKLSRAAMETLAIVAYRQPLTRAEMEEVRGVDCGGVTKTLLERGLVKVVGKKDVVGRPMLFGTTKKFLEIFGLSSLADLPTLREIEEMAGAVGDPVSEWDPYDPFAEPVPAEESAPEEPELPFGEEPVTKEPELSVDEGADVD